MALNFPTSPSNLQEYDEPSNGIRYVYHASKNQWRALAAFATGEVEAQIIDDISSNFNNNAVGPFQLKHNGANIVPFNEQSVLITINGLVKTPVTDYTINSTGQLTFTAGNGPATADKFSGVVYSKIPLTVGSLTVQGGTMSGDITFNSTQTFPVEGIQTATTARYGVTRLNDATDSTSDLLAASSKAVKTTKDVADAALPKAGGTMTGDITFNSTQQFDGRDLSVDGLKLDGIDTGAKDDQTAAEIKTLIATSPLDASHLAADSVDTSEIKDNAVTTAKIEDAELTTLAGMQSGTASILASGTALTATTTEINAICDDKSVETTISDTDAAYPTSGAVVDYVAAQIAPLGGLEVIANEDSFPTQPASGVVISIADAGGIVVNGSGVSTTARTSGNGSDNVTINGFPSTLYSTTLTDNMGLLVSSTGSSNTYTYHKLLGKESDIKSLSDDINDFNNRYRIASSAPSSSLDDGDLWFDTTNNKMKVYNASGTSWDDVAAPGNFFINTLSSSSGSGGGSSTFNGTATRFTLSSPPAQGAQQCIVSVNGVIQKPNSGTSPSEGFAVDGNDIIFAAAPATSSPFFIITLGNSVNIGTPSDNTISTVKLQNQAVNNDKVSNTAAIASTKLSFTQTGSNAVARTVDSKLEDVLSVKDFGATGDGATDDTTAINNCIAAAGLTKAVYFPPGTYITSGINQNHYDNTTWSVNADADGVAKTYRIYGDSPLTSIIKAKASSNSTLVSKVKKIDNIQIQGVQGTVCCINIDHGSQRIHNVKISGDNNNRNTYGIYYSPFHPQNANSSGDSQTCCCAYLNDVVISECATGLAIWGTVSGQSPTSGTGSHHYAAHANDSQYNRIHVYNTTTAGIHIKCRAGGLTFRDTNLSQMSGKGIWIQGGRKLEFDGIYTAAHGPDTTSTYWTVYYDTFVETVSGLKILNPREEQPSTRSYFEQAYNAELRGGTGLNNCKFVGETAYTNDIWRLDNQQDINARDDSGNDTAHWGACISKFPLTNRSEFLSWEGLFDNEFRQATGTTGNKAVAIYDDNANWSTNAYDFVETDIENVTTGRPCAFTYYKGCTDVARMWNFQQGSQSSVGMMVYNSGTYIGMAKVGNGGSSILSLSCTFNFADLLDPTVPKTSSAAPSDGDWITIIPVAKANGGSRYLYKSRIMVACAPLAHQNSWI